MAPEDLTCPCDACVRAVCVHAGIQEIGLEIEEPFGILPLEVICAKTIRDLTSLMNNEEPMWDIATEIYDYPEECGIFRQQ